MPKRDIHQEITDKIIKELEAGTPPWKRGWTKKTGGLSGLPLRVTGQPYAGINVLLLWGAAADAGYSAPHWMTFKQAKELGGCVRKGERGTGIVFFSTFIREDDNGEDQKIGFLKNYTVFNVEQIDGLPEKWTWTGTDEIDEGTRPVEDVQAFFDNTGAAIGHGGNRAFYSKRSDSITMPPIKAFHSAQDYYGTLAHELIHWTGADHRLERLKNTAEKDQDYAFEELVAELGACFLCAHIGCETNLPNSASYIGGWLKRLRDDKRFIFRAATAAQKATEYALERGTAPTAIAAE
ncbi:MAG: zincin-like metallopeptidase domain-containing protein [Pseudomonadota bacterium]